MNPPSYVNCRLRTVLLVEIFISIASLIDSIAKFSLDGTIDDLEFANIFWSAVSRLAEQPESEESGGLNALITGLYSSDLEIRKRAPCLPKFLRFVGFS